jgi:cellulose synthase/poly-beta-1,6-N-acetylglucosamine synthase-like glycosyltransferase
VYQPLMQFTLVIYCISSIMLFIYGINCYIMVFLFIRRKKKALAEHAQIYKDFWEGRKPDELPVVTTQLPIFNEENVVERLIRAVAGMDYPRELHEIQVLDDSTDETTDVVAEIVKAYQKLGYRIVHIHRRDREGYKAGALRLGTELAEGEFIAIFDADFIPPNDFLKKTIPHLCTDEGVGLVQTRWGHLNDRDSLLTFAQSIGIDGHFIIEQSARAWNGLFMNFNGTAGVWRKKAIEDAGGWQGDTLTEDLDLSYRVQILGWRAKFLFDVVTLAEIPEDVNAFKSQQHRWAKGSIQVALKLLPRIWKSGFGLFKKAEATLHLTHYMVHPFILLLALLAFPVFSWVKLTIPLALFIAFMFLIFICAIAPSFLYAVSQKCSYPNWKRRVIFIPFLVCIGVAIALNNTKAILEAFVGLQSGFVRTPKRGDKKKTYTVKASKLVFFEFAVGIYCLYSFSQYWHYGKYVIGPFLFIYSVGFLYISSLSVIQQLRLVKKK